MSLTQRTIKAITARTAVEQDRLKIHDDDTDATMYVKQARQNKPLSTNENTSGD